MRLPHHYPRASSGSSSRSSPKTEDPPGQAILFVCAEVPYFRFQYGPKRLVFKQKVSDHLIHGCSLLLYFAMWIPSETRYKHGSSSPGAEEAHAASGCGSTPDRRRDTAPGDAARPSRAGSGTIRTIMPPSISPGAPCSRFPPMFRAVLLHAVWKTALGPRSRRQGATRGSQARFR